MRKILDLLVVVSVDALEQIKVNINVINQCSLDTVRNIDTFYQFGHTYAKKCIQFRLIFWFLFWQCLHVRTQPLKLDTSHREPDSKKLTFPVGKPTVSVYLVIILIISYYTYLPHPNPCFALGSRLDHQWSSLCGYRPLITQPPALRK